MWTDSGLFKKHPRGWEGNVKEDEMWDGFDVGC